MNKSIFVLGIALLLAACGSDRPTAHTEPSNESPRLESMTASKKQAVASKKVISPVSVDAALANLLKKSGGTVRYDRIRELAAGERQRQVFVEMVGESAKQTDLIAADVFGKAGFEIRKGRVDENGIRLQYRRPDINPLNILIRTADAGPKLVESGATSSFYLKQLADE